MLRDKRDPQEIGRALQSMRRQHPRTKITKLADKVLKNDRVNHATVTNNGSPH